MLNWFHHNHIDRREDRSNRRLTCVIYWYMYVKKRRTELNFQTNIKFILNIIFQYISFVCKRQQSKCLSQRMWNWYNFMRSCMKLYIFVCFFLSFQTISLIFFFFFLIKRPACKLRTTTDWKYIFTFLNDLIFCIKTNTNRQIPTTKTVFYRFYPSYRCNNNYCQLILSFLLIIFFVVFFCVWQK